ncbi:MAG: SGNH/GDSL hydrolase family protein [Spirochaetales bacterium]|nr:SGNH/GDSL hydrolase family protein [Spirochaetales bacterium]
MDKWIVTWASAQQLIEPENLPPAPGLQKKTLRQVIRVSAGGEGIRLKFSNVFSSHRVVMESVSLAVSTGGSSVSDKSIVRITFQGKSGATIPPHEEIYSDPINFSLKSQSDLAVSIFFSSIDKKKITGHPGSRSNSYVGEGDVTFLPDVRNAVQVTHWYILAGLEVWAPDSSSTLVILGDSLTDGRGSTTDQNDRWTDALVRRLGKNKDTAAIGVYNAGLGGNCVIRGGLGPPLLKRLKRDALDQEGVRWLIVLEGTNDIGEADTPKKAEKVQGKLIVAYKEIIKRAHQSGILVYGATITPFGGSFYDKPETEAARQEVNNWIRTGGEFDAVIDMDKYLRDPENPSKLKPSVHCGDYLHLNPSGYQMMADAVDLKLFVK